MKRNYGIDLLRMILMLMVVVLHVLAYGGVIKATAQLSANYNMSWLLKSFSMCAVNCYALISGYVYINARYRFSSVIQICLQALLYSAGIAICMWIVNPASFSVKNLIYYLFPVSNAQYWYLSAYVGLFVLIPLLNAGINTLSKEQAKNYLYLLFFVFTIIPSIARLDTFFVNAGYSTFWLAYLYFIGACIKKFGFGDTLGLKKTAWIYIGCVLISWGTKIGCEGITKLLLGTAKTGFLLIEYTSPTMVIAAVSLFLTFKNMRIPSKVAGFIAEFSPAAFGVYLIHENKFVRDRFILDKFVHLTELSAPLMAVGVVMAALTIFFACLFIDWIRCKVFTWIHVKERLEKLENKYIHYNIAIK